MVDRAPVSIRLRVMLIVAISVVAIVASRSSLTRSHFDSEIRDLSYRQLSMLAESLKITIVEMMKVGDTDHTLDSAYERMAQKQPGVLALRVVRGEALSRQFGVNKHKLAESELEKKGLHSRDPIIKQFNGDQDQRIEFVYPLFADQVCLSCHQAKMDEPLGVLSLKLDSSGVHKKIEAENLRLLYVSLVEIALLLIVLLWTLNRLVFTPLDRLGEASNRMARGDLDADIGGEGGDELGVVVSAFNRMAGKIKALIGDQEKVIQEQALELTHLIESSEYIGSEQPLPDLLNRFAKSLVDMLKVTTCRMLLMEDNGTLQLCSEYPIRPVGAAAPPSCSGVGCPTIWNAIAARKSMHFDRQAELTETERRLLCMDEADSALIFPVVNRGNVLGLVVLTEFRSHKREPIDGRKRELCRAMVSQMGAAIEMGKLLTRLIDQLMETVLAMAETVEKKSPWTAGHSRRVTDYALSLAQEIGWHGDQLEQLRTAGLLHDLGKIGVPGHILNKERSLTEEEYAIIKRHPEDGAQILSKIRMLRAHVPIIRHHHEWFDGSGYPDGLRGEEIPLGARILAVADAYDAMTADRPYRNGMTPERALSLLRQGIGTQFDTELVNAFSQLIWEP